MKQAIDHVINAAMMTNKDQLNVLYLGYNGIIDSLFRNNGINYYIVEEAQKYVSNIELPDNFTKLPYGVNYIPNRIDLNAVIVNHRFQHIADAAHIADTYHLPLILVDHDLPGQNSTMKLRHFMNSQLPKRCVHVVPHPIVMQEWGIDNAHLIPYHLPVTNIVPKVRNVLVVGSENVISDHMYITGLLNTDPNSLYVGRNGIYNTPYKNLDEMLKYISESYITVALQSDNQPPILPLLAMKNGSVVVTNRTRWTSSIISDGVNGFLFSSIDEAKKIIRKLLSDKMWLHDIIKEAEETENTVDSHGLWQRLVRNLATKAYIR